MDPEPGRGGDAPGRVRAERDGLRHAQPVRRLRRALRGTLALTLLTIPAPALLQSEPTWLERYAEIEADLPNEFAIRALEDLWEELAADQRDGVVFDTDRATAFFRAAEELAWLPEARALVAKTPLELYDAVLPVADRLEAADERATPAMNVAAELNRAGKYDRARDVAEGALERFPDATQMRAHLLLDLAETDGALGRLADSWKRVDEAEEAMRLADVAAGARPVYEDEVMFRALQQRMHLLLALGLPDRHGPFLTDLEARVGEDDPFVLWWHAQFRLATDRHQEVVDDLAPRLERDRFEPDEWANLQLALAMAEAEQSRMDGRSPERAIEWFEAVRRHPRASYEDVVSAQLRLVPLRMREGDLEAARELLEGLDRERLHEVRRRWLAALEARLALASGAPPDELERALGRLRAVYDEYLETWSAAPQRAGGLGFLHYVNRRDLVTELIRLTLAVEGSDAGAERAARDLMRARALGTVARRLRDGGPEASLEELQRELLGPGRGVLVVVPGIEHSHVFAIDSERVVCAEVPATARWDPERRKIERELFRPPAPGEVEASAERAANAAAALAELLLPDEVRERLATWEELYVENAQLTGFLPFELLPVDGTPLGMTYPMAYLPSLNVGCLLMRREARPGSSPRWDLGLIADPDGASPELDLPWNDAYEAEVGRIYGGGRLSVRKGARANPSALLDAALMGSPVLQLVLHGVYDPLRERPNGFAMAPDGASDGKVWCETIEALPRLPRLVVLAVCGASRGPLRSGDDGISNLGGAFLSTGSTNAVLLSPYDLEFDATMALTDVFHERLRRRGAPPAQAMLEARRAIAARPQYRHPYYHSLLPVVGIGHVPLFDPVAEARTPAYLIALGLLALAVASIALLRRSRRARA